MCRALHRGDANRCGYALTNDPLRCIFAVVSHENEERTKMLYESGAYISRGPKGKTIRRAVDYENSRDALVKSTNAIIVAMGYGVVSIWTMGVVCTAGIVVEH